MDLYRQASFEGNYFGSLNIGAQVYHFKFFAPEIGYDNFYGKVPDREIKFSNFSSGYHDALFWESFSTSVLTLNPKLEFGKEDAFLIISPKYHIGNVKTRTSYYTPISGNSTYRREKYQQGKSPISYWSFAVGFEGIYLSPHFWFGITLNYIQLNIQDNWEVLDFSEYDITSESPGTTTIGFGFHIYYDPFANEND